MNMPKSSIVPIIITALLLFPAGFITGSLIASGNESTNDSPATEEVTTASESHDHPQFEIAEAKAPAIDSLSITEDAKSGWNLSFTTSKFQFMPEDASGDHADGKGHAHLYIDGEKITRLYSPNYYIGELDEGEHTIRVTLNTNDHKDYTINGAVIEAAQTISDAHHADDAESEPHSH